MRPETAVAWRVMASLQGPSCRSRAARPAVRATTRACWPVRVAWSRQASRLARSARAHASARGRSGRSGTAAGGEVSGGRGGPGPGLAGQAGLGEGGGVLVVVQEPAQGGVSLGGGVGGGQGPGVLADQVVQPVPAAGGLGEQVLVVQGRQAAAGGAQIGVIERGGGVGVDVGARVQPQAAEQPLLARGQVGVGQVERGGDREVLRRHQLQPVPRRGQVARPARPGSRPDGGAAGGPASRPPAAGTRTAG